MMGYIFDPERLQQIAQLGMGLPHEEMCNVVIDALAREYPGHIEREPEWCFNLAAGAVGMMAIVHASLTEYVLIFGSAIGTDSFSGRYRMDVYDTVITGEMWTYRESEFRRREEFKPGDMALLRRGDAKAYRIIADTWMLEYARGLIPASIGVGLADTVFSALDGTTLWKTLRTYGKLVTRELLKGKI
jgi:hypothetical protein